MGELSTNWNPQDVSLKSLEIFFGCLLCETNFFVDSNINASCEYSCSLCAAKHAGIITHSIHIYGVFTYIYRSKINQMPHIGRYTIPYMDPIGAGIIQFILVSPKALQVLVSGWTKSLAPPILMPSPCTGTPRERNCTMVPWLFPSHFKATKFQSLADWSYVYIIFCFLIIPSSRPNGQVVVKIGDFHSDPQIDFIPLLFWGLGAAFTINKESLKTVITCRYTIYSYIRMI